MERLLAKNNKKNNVLHVFPIFFFRIISISMLNDITYELYLNPKIISLQL